jgi:8-oxo-dGTP pyrophosphatase MutT (NUDIX family)
MPQILEVFQQHSTKIERTSANSPFRLPEFPEAAIPKDKQLTMAMDDALTGNLSFCNTGWASGGSFDGFPGDGNGFLGYSLLSLLAQRPEYRVMAETIADDATREWIDFDVVGDEKANQEEAAKDPEGFAERMADPDEKQKRVKEAGKTDKVKALKDDQLRLEVAHRFHAQSRNNGFFGRSHLLLDIRTNGREEASADEVKTPIGTGAADDVTSKSKVTRGSFFRLQTIEPVWTYPMAYNAWDPTREDWYNPQIWYVMGKEFHGSRLQTFIAHPVPDMLKPAYAFGGLSLSEMARPYVDIWLQTRTAVARLIHSFSVMVLKTDLSALLNNNNAAQLLTRVAMFNMMRDNSNTYVINEATEDFANVSAPLSGLHELQAQAQEHMASVHRIPLVKFTGIQPSGLNASSEGEIKTYDDTIAAYQKRVLDPNLRRIINFEQLSLWGEIDPEITFTWKPLREMTLAEKGQKEKDDADRNQKYVDMGALAPGEIRKAIIEDPDLPYTGLDPDDVPEPPAEEGLLGPGAGGAAKEFEQEHAPEEGLQQGQGGGANDAADPFGATDAEWREDDHPRAPDGKFGSGNGSTAHASAVKKMPGIPDFLKKEPGYKPAGQTLKMPQFGLTPTPGASHQFSPSAPFKMPPRKPMPKSEGDPAGAGNVVAFEPGKGHGIKSLNGVEFQSFSPPDDWASVEGQAEIDEPPMFELADGMRAASGCLIQEPDGRVWLMRPKNGYGGYDQTFPKGGMEEGLSPQANAIKEAWEETGLKVRITGFAGDHEGDTGVTRFYHAVREGGDPADAGEETEGVVLAPASKLGEMVNRKRDRDIVATLSSGQEKPKLKPADLKKVGGKMGSNEGGTFEDKDGNRFYIKRPKTKEHVENEMAAARLYQLAGVNTLTYREVEGGNHVATELVKLDKDNVSKLTPSERQEATKDFAIHAWLGNYDAAGTGGDNQGVVGGKVTTLDVGGSLRFRAQGAPKGAGWGPKVKEIDTMRGKDPSVHAPDAARLFGKMSESDLKASAQRVTTIPDAAIRKAAGSDTGLADTLIERKRDLAKRFDLTAQDAALAGDEANFEESKHPRAPDGKFTSGTGGGSGGSTPAFKSKKEHAAHLLSKGTTTQEMLTALNWPSISMPQMAKTLGMKLEKTKEGGVTKYKGVKMTPEELAAAKATAPAPQKVEIKQTPAPPPATKHGPATEAELAKAKKNVALQLKYVPGAPQDSPMAQKLVDAFNKKWHGVEPTLQSTLEQKVSDFKDLVAAMKPMQGEAQKANEAAAAKAAAAAKQAAIQKAAEAAELAKQAASKNKAIMDELGISAQQAEGVATLAQMMGSTTGDIVDHFKKYEAQAKQYGYPITGFQCALIKNYSGSGFAKINDVLRKGAWTPAQHAYVAMVNKALMGMPKHTGPGLTRNTHLTPEQQKAYVEGHIIQEHAFMSTSTKSVFSGNTQFKVTAIGRRGASIKKLSSHPSEDEVLFAAKTYFKVNKVEGTPGGQMTIHIEEWEEHV